MLSRRQTRIGLLLSILFAFFVVPAFSVESGFHNRAAQSHHYQAIGKPGKRLQQSLRTDRRKIAPSQEQFAFRSEYVGCPIAGDLFIANRLRSDSEFQRPPPASLS